MLSIRYILFRFFFRLEKCLELGEFSFTVLTQSGQHFNGTGQRHWPVFLIFDSPVNDSMYIFSLVLIRKTMTRVFLNDVISIVMMPTEVIEGE